MSKVIFCFAAGAVGYGNPAMQQLAKMATPELLQHAKENGLLLNDELPKPGKLPSGEDDAGGQCLMALFEHADELVKYSFLSIRNWDPNQPLVQKHIINELDGFRDHCLKMPATYFVGRGRYAVCIPDRCGDKPQARVLAYDFLFTWKHKIANACRWADHMFKHLFRQSKMVTHCVDIDFESEDEKLALFDQFGRVPKVEELQLEELASFNDVKLNFAILGVENCGTSQLVAGLERHPKIQFTSRARPGKAGEEHLVDPQNGVSKPAEDTFFMGVDEMPTKAQVDAYNSGSEDRSMFLEGIEPIEKWRPVSDGKVRGLKQVMLFDNPRAQGRVASVPWMKAVVSLRDPLDRFEHHLFTEYHAHIAYHTEYDPGFALLLEDAEMDDHGTIILPYDFKERLLQSVDLVHRHFLSNRLEYAWAIFGPRNVYITHMDEVSFGKEFWNNLANFIGAGEFPADVDFEISDAEKNRALKNDGSRFTDAPKTNLRSPEMADALAELNMMFLPDRRQIVEMLNATEQWIPPRFLEDLELGRALPRPELPQDTAWL